MTVLARGDICRVPISPPGEATLHGLGKDRYDFRPTRPRDEQWQIVG